MIQVIPRTRRGVELMLLIVALVVAVGVLTVIAHVTLRLRAPYADPVLLPCVVLLNGLGLAMIHRIDLAKDEATAAEQLTWTAIGVLLFVAMLVAIRDHRRLQALTYTS